MRSTDSVRRLALLAPVLGALLFVDAASAQKAAAPPAKYPTLPSETPAKLQPSMEGFDYVRRDVMIPMRDRVKLHTVILVPKGAKGAPILLTRGRYRESLETAKPLAPDKPLLYRFALPTANHVFLPGHRLMVQVQSSWFPLYDRNPQTFVPNIFWARPGDYRKAVQRIYHSPAPGQASFVELPLAATP